MDEVWEAVDNWTDSFLEGKPDGQLVWAGIGWKARTDTMRLLIARHVYNEHVGKYIASKGLNPELYLNSWKLRERAKKLQEQADEQDKKRAEIEKQLQKDIAYWVSYHEDNPDEEGITISPPR